MIIVYNIFCYFPTNQTIKPLPPLVRPTVYQKGRFDSLSGTPFSYYEKSTNNLYFIIEAKNIKSNVSKRKTRIFQKGRRVKSRFFSVGFCNAYNIPIF